jgi:hypothetical protein
MSIFGLTDPWIIAAYAGCILSVIFCVAYSLIVGRQPDEEEEIDE